MGAAILASSEQHLSNKLPYFSDKNPLLDLGVPILRARLSPTSKLILETTALEIPHMASMELNRTFWDKIVIRMVVVAAGRKAAVNLREVDRYTVCSPMPSA